jgi:hypothetical protein
MSMNVEASEAQAAAETAPQRGVPPGAGLALAVVLGSSFWMGVIALAF